MTEVPEHLRKRAEEARSCAAKAAADAPADAPAEPCANSRRRHPRFRLTCLSGPKRPRPRWLTAAMPVARWRLRRHRPAQPLQRWPARRCPPDLVATRSAC